MQPPQAPYAGQAGATRVGDGRATVPSCGPRVGTVRRNVRDGGVDLFVGQRAGDVHAHPLVQREAGRLVVEGVNHQLQVIALAHVANVMQLLPP